jgi:hypothetical protein
VTVEGGKIHDCRHHGVLVNASASATVRCCEIYDVQGQAIAASPRAKEIALDRNNIHDCLERQVGGTTSAEDCVVM